MNEPHKDLEPRVKTLEISFARFSEETNKNFRAIFDKLDSIGMDVNAKYNEAVQRSDAASKPNMSTWIGFGGILLTIIGMVASPILVGAVREWDRLDRLNRELDVKLQHEFGLALETSKEATTRLEALSKERHEQAMLEVGHANERLNQMRQFIIDQTNEDLKELRARRMTDKPHN